MLLERLQRFRTQATVVLALAGDTDNLHAGLLQQTGNRATEFIQFHQSHIARRSVTSLNGQLGSGFDVQRCGERRRLRRTVNLDEMESIAWADQVAAQIRGCESTHQVAGAQIVH